MNESNGVITDARELGTVKMLILGLQHMFAMFGATIIVPILVSGYFHKACGEPLTRGLSVSVTLFCAGFGTLIFHLCTKFKVPAFLGSSFAFLGGFYTVAPSRLAASALRAFFSASRSLFLASRVRSLSSSSAASASRSLLSSVSILPPFFFCRSSPPAL